LLDRPVRTLVLASCCVMALGLAGLNAESRLHQTSLAVAGTESARTAALLKDHFGDSETFVILLKGPRKAVDAQGKRLLDDLNPRATTVSPWSREPIGELRPTRRSALIFVSFKVGTDEAVEDTVPYLNDLLDRRTAPPVRAVQSGYASVTRAIQEEAARATQRGELIAIPLVLVALLLVFRSPVAAAIPLAFGGATAASSRGVLSIVAGWMSIDAFALTASAMMGLALGIDYTLLMVSRFREELEAGKSPVAAAHATRRTAGRTIVYAGGALFISMVVSALILPGTLLVSLAGAVVVVAGISVLLGVLVVPSLLAIVGDRIDRWSLPGRQGQGPWVRLIGRTSRQPGLVTALLLVPLLALALPAVSLGLGPPGPDQLPSTNTARLNAELVNREIGPGWAAPYEVLAATERGPITAKDDLAGVKRWEADVRAMSGVQAVIGPGAISSRIAPIDRFGRSLLAQDGPGTQTSQLRKLGSGLERAARGVGDLRGGISEASAGAHLLADGSRRVHVGANGVAAGIEASTVGTEKAVGALDRLAAAADDMHRGQRKTAFGALAVKYEIRDLIPRLRHGTLLPSQQLQQQLIGMEGIVQGLNGSAQEVDQQLGLAAQELERIPEVSGDPRMLAALSALQAARTDVGVQVMPGQETSLVLEIQNLENELQTAQGRADKVAAGATGRIAELEELLPIVRRLVGGLDDLKRGGEDLDAGTKHLARSSAELVDRLPQLAQGARALSTGTEELEGGTASLAGGLSEANTRSVQIAPRLRDAATKSTENAEVLRRRSDQLRALSPGIFDSGYFNLAALAGTPPGLRTRVEQAVNVNRGGQAVRILVIPDHDHSVGLDRRLRASTPRLAASIQGTAGVAGGPAQDHDYEEASNSLLPMVVIAVALVTFLCLVLVLRAVIASAIAVLLNLLSVAVAFGALALVSDLPSGALIGNWGYIDTIGAVAIFAIAFGVSIDYSVFILARMREEFDNSNDHKRAVAFGVERTGRVITGAAIMMVAVFAAFATSSLAIVSQLGLGLTVAILMDATVVRLVLLPALLLLVGDRAWWLPSGLDRALRTRGAA
jgi:RND superfamily putative drug exporter